MTKIYKTAFFCFLIATTFTACKKDSKSSNGPGTGHSKGSMSYVDNGTKVNFSRCYIVETDANGGHQVQMNGDNNTSAVNFFSVSVVGELKDLKAGQTYEAYHETFGDEAGTMQLALFAGDEMLFSNPYKRSGTVTITSVSSTEVKGTFSGDIYSFDDDYAEGPKEAITNGTFTAEVNIL